jgi:hypothetical protein
MVRSETLIETLIGYRRGIKKPASQLLTGSISLNVARSGVEPETFGL